MERGSTYFALFAVLYGLGLRVGEASNSEIKDVDLERRLLLIRDEVLQEPPRAVRP